MDRKHESTKAIVTLAALVNSTLAGSAGSICICAAVCQKSVADCGCAQSGGTALSTASHANSAAYDANSSNSNPLLSTSPVVTA